MKIAFAFTNFPTGGGLSNISRVTGLLDLGYDVAIYALGPDPNLKKNHELVDEYRLCEKTYYYGGTPAERLAVRLAQNFVQKPAITLRECGRALDTALSYNRLYAYLRGHSSNRAALAADERQSFANAYRILQHFQQNGVPDIFNVFNGASARKLIFLKDVFPRLKFIATFVGFDFSSRIRIYGTDYYDELFQKADLILTKSKFSRECLLELGCPRQKIHVHYNGVNLRTFPYSPRVAPMAHQPFNFITVARLVEKKNHRVLLAAFARLARRHKNVRLQIVGDGPLRQQIEQQIRADEFLRKCVHLSGWRTHEEVAAFLRQSHVFVLPSVTSMRWAEMEDTPTALIEAQAVGLPVISTHHAGIAEIVDEGKTGYLVSERNEDQLFSAMETMLLEKERWAAMAKNARRLVEERFDLDILCAELDDIFTRMEGRHQKKEKPTVSGEVRNGILAL